jgi:site-specific recombinase
MTERVKAALEMIQRQLKELDALVVRAAEDTNAVAAGERLAKWKARTVQLLATQVGAAEAKRFAETKLARDFFYGDLTDEVNEETDLYRSHLASLTARINQGTAIFESP